VLEYWVNAANSITAVLRDSNSWPLLYVDAGAETTSQLQPSQRGDLLLKSFEKDQIFMVTPDVIVQNWSED
jgi:hypothetical protein